ncbi:malto-oligosyltrehalose trehalohydrolase [Rhodopila globiformis]|uniref:Malto-oligosyltrehalose trehalohydrolase n=1 Tax=Rhodopila globiformis TaxID=1071 RepID=A0A2S6N6A3_RHOGL|nr:malto-oligosyltrehalose trehalohydrolase [Rhodopila globiformis]PPQ30141.1 malto-oligosyltrehalose trehalohydrolase [Rhodopila globiformis]
MNYKTSSACRFGATRLDSGAVEFRLWAPAQETVSVAIESGGVLPMQRSPDGWFVATAPVPAGTRYHFRLADGLMVPDPASLAQASDVHGASIVMADDFAWRHPDWKGRPWTEAIIYEVHPGVAGGFRAIRDDLPRLKTLGVTAIELMPVNDFPGQRNWGYDGVLPYAPDSAYGTPEDLKELIDAAHGLGLMMFLDVVYNHFGPDGNYLFTYAPQFFRDDVKTPWGPAIDFRRREVRDYFICNVMMWLVDYRFDGLRFDAVHAIQEQDWIEEMAATVRRGTQPGRHVHLILEHHNQASHLRNGIDAQWNDDGHNVLHALLTNEDGGYYADYADDPAAKLARVLAEGWVYQGERSAYLNQQRGQPCGDLPPTAHVLFLQNHDQIGNRAFGERLTTLVSPRALEAAITLQMLCPQIPLLFMGEEIASTTPFLFFTDHHNELADAVREGRRQEFAGFAAFADPAKRAQIPDPNAEPTFVASIPRPGPGAAERFALYQRLITLRMQEIVPRLPGTTSTGATVIGPRAVRAGWRMGDGARLTIVTNLGTDSVPFDAPQGRLLFSSADPGKAGPVTTAYLEIVA